MSDYRNELIKSVEISLASTLDPDAIELVSRKLFVVLDDYEITKRSTEIATQDFGNERIIKRYLACLAIDGKSPNTIYYYQRILVRFDEFIRKPLADVTVYDLRYYLACEKERELSNTTIENTRSTISAFYQWMTNEELIPKNPCGAIKPIKCPHKEKYPFSAVELDILRHACSRPKERAIIEILVSSGIRVAELSNMDISDVDFHEKTMHVRNGKGGKDRTVFMSDVAKMHLQKYIESRSDNNVALICNKNYQRIRTGGIRKVLKIIANRANVSNVHPHRFRRTFATSMARRGMPIQEIQILLGHSNITTTTEYVCVDNAKVQASYRQHIA